MNKTEVPSWCNNDGSCYSIKHNTMNEIDCAIYCPDYKKATGQQAIEALETEKNKND
jgi:hypothetical protein